MDPFYIIFEQHLFNFEESGSDQNLFVRQVVQDYLSYLRKHNISIPRSLEESIIEELAEQVRAMLVKKMYGFYSLPEYQKNLSNPEKKRVKARYSKLKR